MSAPLSNHPLPRSNRHSRTNTQARDRRRRPGVPDDASPGVTKLQAQAGGSASSPHRILLVDDDPGIRDSLRSVLESEGYQVLTAADGFEAQRIASRDAPDLVLLDLKMPGLSGWDTYERLTTNNPLIPVVVITARPGQFFTAAAAGVGALLEKPLDIDHMLELVRDLLDESAQQRLARITGRQTSFAYVPSQPPAT